MELMSRRMVLMRDFGVLPADEIDVVSAKNIANDQTPVLTNDYGTTLGSTAYDGEIVVTQVATDSQRPQNPTDYRNGMFTLRMKTNILCGHYIRLVAEVQVTESLLSADYLSIAPYGSSADAVTAPIINGRINVVFYFGVRDNRQYIAIRNCGNSLIMKNVKFYFAD